MCNLLSYGSEKNRAGKHVHNKANDIKCSQQTNLGKESTSVPCTTFILGTFCKFSIISK